MTSVPAPAVRPSHGYPLPEGYAERLLRAAGCTGAVLLGWRDGQGPRCRMCGTVAALPTARLWEALSAWRRPDPLYGERRFLGQVLGDPAAAGVIMSAGAALVRGGR